MARGQGVFAALQVRGSIGDTFTFSRWKGIQVIKKKPFPTNPNTVKQQTQRGYFSGAVASWHDILLEHIDVKGWNQRATLGPDPMSGFNSYTSRFCLLRPAGDVGLIYGCRMVQVGPTIVPKIKSNTAGQMTFSCIRGPNAGYAQTQAVVVGVQKDFLAIPDNRRDIYTWSFSGGGKLAESGYFFGIADG